MKKVFVLAVGALFLMTAAARAEEGTATKVDPMKGTSQMTPRPEAGEAVHKAKSKVKKTKKKAVKEVKAVWACPMGHMKSDKPGKCATCGMDLEKVSPNKE